MTKTEYKKHLIVHTLKSKNGIDDDYRFSDRFGVYSSKELDIKALRELCLILGYKGVFNIKKMK